MSIPDNVAAEIAAKRQPDAEDGSDNKDDKETKPESKEEGKETKKPEKKEDAPEKKGKAAKPKNGQSIAQVAEAADDEDDEDDDDEEGDDDHDSGKKPGSQKRSGLFKEFMGLKRELKDQKRANKEMDKQYREVASALTELVDVVKDLKGNKSAQRDEIEEFAEEWGLDKEGLKKLTGILEKNLSTKFKPTKAKDDDEDEDEEDDEPRKKKSKSEPKKSEINARKVELAIEAEYEDYLDSFPQVKGKINLKAIKRFIIGDEENLEKSFADIVSEMYPGVLDSKGGVDGGSDIGDGEDDGEKMDFNDPKVLAQLDKNPKLKTKYHDDLLARVKGLKS